MYDSAELDAAYGGGSVSVAASASGEVVAFVAHQSLIFIDPPETVAQLTVRLPPDPVQGQLAALSFGAVVSALALETAGGVAVATAAGAIGTEISFRFIDGAWRAWDAPGAVAEVPLTAPPVNRDVPYASQSGMTLDCTMGNWDNEPTSYAYEWSVDGAKTSSGSQSTLAVTADDAGRTATCVVTATNAIGSTEAPASNPVIIASPPARRAR
jgi:hypothetical protein